MICRAIVASNVVEVGTSFDVSTMYLALAVGGNTKLIGQSGKVIATDEEDMRIKKAREYWDEAGRLVEKNTELREVDIREIWPYDFPVIDLLLLDSKSLHFIFLISDHYHQQWYLIRF